MGENKRIVWLERFRECSIFYNFNTWSSQGSNRENICLSQCLPNYYYQSLLINIKERRTKEPLDESERGEWKSWLKAQHSENYDHDIWSITSWQIDGETGETVTGFILGGSKITAAMKLKDTYSLEEKVMTNPDSILKSRDITLPTKVHLVKAMVFPVVMLWMWELDYKESWEPKNWCFWTVVLEKTLESPLDCKEIQPVHPKGNQSWIFIGRIDAEADTPILWPPDVKNGLIVKDPNAGKDWGQEEKGTTEDEMSGWHTNSMDMNLVELRELVMDRESWPAAIHGVSKSRTRLSDWTDWTDWMV